MRRKIPTLKTVQEKISEKKLPQWAELERKADRLIEIESKQANQERETISLTENKHNTLLLDFPVHTLRETITLSTAKLLSWNV